MTDTADQIAASLHKLRAAWPHMLQPGPRGRTGGANTTGSREAPTPAPIDILSLRREVCEVLASWCRVVIDDAVDVEGGHMDARLNSGDADQMAGWLLTWADYLGGHDAGDDAAQEIGKMAHKCHAIANPQRKDWMALGTCPLKVEAGTCGGQVRGYPDSDRQPTCQRCGTEAAWRWWETQMFQGAEIREWLTDADVVDFVRLAYGTKIEQATVRQWVRRGVLTSTENDATGRRLFSREEVVYMLDRRKALA